MTRRHAGPVLAALLASGVSAQVDWRPAQSPVKNQGHRGTCAAHAIAAAMETFPGIPDDLSEQFLYGIQKRVDLEGREILAKFGIEQKAVEGTFLLAYLDWFRIYGAPHERYLPYEGGKWIVKDVKVPEELKVMIELTHLSPDKLAALGDAWGKYSIDKATGLLGPEARDVATIKKWLDAGALAIPAAYRIHGPTWSKFLDMKVAAEAQEPLFTPEEMEEFADPVLGWLPYRQAKVQAAIDRKDFCELVGAGTMGRRDKDREKDAEQRYGGHSMTIVGYTDKAFIVKNSWGERWGNRGYGFVSFDFHRLYCLHCARIESVKTRIPALSPFEKTKRIRESDYRLRVQPIRGASHDELAVSLYAMDARDPMLEVVEYEIEAKGAQGSWRSIAKEVVTKRGQPKDYDHDPGFAHRIAASALDTTAKDATELRITVAFGHFPLGDPTKPGEAAFLVKHSFGPFPRRPERALDLAAR